MRLRWSAEAAADLDRIYDYIAVDRPDTAVEVGSTILATVASLEQFPALGRAGRVAGTRELPLPPLPFVAVYETSDEHVIVLRLLHGAQRWPPV